MTDPTNPFFELFDWAGRDEPSDWPTHLRADLYGLDWSAKFEEFVGRYLAARAAEDGYYDKLASKPLSPVKVPIVKDGKVVTTVNVVVHRDDRTAEEKILINNIRQEKISSLVQAIGAGTLASMSRESILWGIEVEAAAETEARLRKKPWHWSKLLESAPQEIDQNE